MNTPRKPKLPPPTPISGLGDKRFIYTASYLTDLAKTFQRVRAELAAGKRPL